MIRINIAAHPPREVSTLLLQLARKSLPASQSLFRTGEGGSSFHLTLYMAQFDEARTPVILDRVSLVAQSVSAMTCDAQMLAVTAGGYIEIGYAKTAALIGLQHSIADCLADIAAPTIMPTHIKPTEDQLRNLSKYHYELVGDSFRPHVTLGRLSVGGSIHVSDLSYDTFSFKSSEITIAEANDQGSAIRTMNRVPTGTRSSPCRS